MPRSPSRSCVPQQYVGAVGGGGGTGGRGRLREGGGGAYVLGLAAAGSGASRGSGSRRAESIKCGVWGRGEGAAGTRGGRGRQAEGEGKGGWLGRQGPTHSLAVAVAPPRAVASGRVFLAVRGPAAETGCLAGRAVQSRGGCSGGMVWCPLRRSLKASWGSASRTRTWAAPDSGYQPGGAALRVI